MIEDIKWKGKPLNLTRHALEELEKSRKNIDIIIEILERGMHIKESKKKQKAILKSKGGKWEVIYIEREDILIIHIKRVRL